MQATLFSEPTPKKVVLEVKGIIPSFKTQKYAIGWRDKVTGKIHARPMIQSEHKKWMAKTVQDFVSQFISAIPTTGHTITTADIQQFLTASLPRDDSWKYVPETVLTSGLCNPEDVGATITIERL